MLDPKLRSPKERPLFVIGVILSSIAWLALVVSIVGIVYGLLIAFFILAAHALFLAHVRGNGIRVSERQLPELHARVQAAATKLGMKELPEIYVLQGGGLLNAFATKLLSRKYVILLSDLVDHCQDPRQLDFVVGHELGHLAAGHLAWNAFLAPYHIFPWLGAGYSRAREYTCDRCGHLVTEDLDQSIRGLAVLAAGGKLAAQVDLPAFLYQRNETGSFWAAVLELNSTHPYLCKRAAALQELAVPGSVQPVGRNFFAWPLAPFFGMAAGGGGGAAGAMVAVAIIGMMAAIAIPNYLKFQERAKQAAAAGRPAAAAALLGEPGAEAPAGLTAEQTESLEWVRQVRARIAEEERQRNGDGDERQRNGGSDERQRGGGAEGAPAQRSE